MMNIINIRNLIETIRESKNILNKDFKQKA